jgi:hypothetical protein
MDVADYQVASVFFQLLSGWRKYRILQQLLV